MIAPIMILVLIFNLSGVQSLDMDSIGDQLGNIGLNGRNSSELNLNEIISDLNEVLSYLVKRIESNPSLFTDPTFFRGFIGLMNKITNITDILGNWSSIDTTIDQNLKNLNASKLKLIVLMKSYAKTPLKPLQNMTDTSTEALDFWNIIWKLMDKIDDQVYTLRGRTESNATTEALGFIRPKDPIRNLIILNVLTQIKEQLASNETLAPISKSLSLKELMAKVVDIVDQTLGMASSSTTPMPTPFTTKPKGNGIINSIFSRIRNVLNGQMRATTTPPIMTTPSLKINENKDRYIKDIVSQVIDHFLKEGSNL